MGLLVKHKSAYRPQIDQFQISANIMFVLNHRCHRI